MNRPNLAQLLAESARKAAQEQAGQKEIERLTASVKAQLKPLLDAADDKAKTVSCPNCGSEINVSWQSDSVTSETGNSDSDNQQDGQDSYNPGARHAALTRALIASSKKQI